ncbi:ribonucleotide reductase subunit alpha [Chitinimonas naiadis]
MLITSFADLLAAAKAEPEPQRLLFVFAETQLPDGANATQRSAYAAGSGGAIVPVMCVDKAPSELSSFAALREESLQMTNAWQLVIVASLGGRGGQMPSGADAAPHLDRMIESIKQGRMQNFLVFDRSGDLLALKA